MKKHKDFKILPVIFVVCVIIVILLISGLILVKKEETSQMTNEIGDITINSKKEEVIANTSMDYLEIATKFCTLYYPKQWENNLEVKTEANTTSFCAKLENRELQKLFDISFENGDGDLVGEIVGDDDDKIKVYTKIYSINIDDTWSRQEADILMSMQEAINELIDNLPLEESSEDVKENESIVIQTPYCELQYPERWKEYLQIEVVEENAYIVNFNVALEGKDTINIFNLIFEEETEGTVGVIIGEDGQNVGISVEIKNIEFDDNWLEEEKDIVYSMQEAVNELTEALPLI